MRLQLHNRINAIEQRLAMLAGDANPTPPWEPLLGPQSEAYHSTADVTGYGGAAGGGKTALIVGLALTRHSRSIIYRRELRQIRAILEYTQEIMGDAGNLNEQLYIWRNLPGGRSIEFGGADSLKAARRYQGRPHDLVAFDEATEIPEPVVRFLMGWNRTTASRQRCRVVMTFNPPTSSEGEWVLRYFAAWLDDKHPNPAVSGELRWYLVQDGVETEVPEGTPGAQSRTFIAASLKDNPYLLETGYETTLQALPEPLRSQLLFGDFKAGIGSDPWQVIPIEWVKMAQARWHPTPPDDTPMHTMGVDVARGGQDRTVIARRHGNWFAPLLVYPGKDTPDGKSVAAQVAAHHEGNATICVDVIGVGSSVFDVLREHQHFNVVGVNVGAKSKEKDKSGMLGFTNKKAELWWRFREALDPDSGQDIALPPDPELTAELCGVRWALQSNGIAIEGKDKVRQSLGVSTDKADAVVLSFIQPTVLVWGVA